MLEKVVKCYFMPLLQLSYIYWLIHFKTDLKTDSAFLWAVKFLATFNLQIDITMDIFWGKLQNNIF